MTRYLSLALFIVCVVLGGTLIGIVTIPGEWYQNLAKPSFNPPNWIFGPVWTALYILIAIAGWRVWRLNPVGAPVALWSMQLALNFAWSPIFFAAQLPRAALIVVVSLLVVIMGFVAAAWREDRVAALLFLPYLAWVAYAVALNAAIVWLNQV
ncbi:MAG: tryptophan-rich sensory protein [Rhizobiaceae bacterium]|nr:tryptophan-rich sensory protein [Rhizobiaceae bacterium]